MEDYASIDRRIDATKAFGAWLRQLIVDQGLQAGLVGVSLLGENDGKFIVSSEDEGDFLLTFVQLQPQQHQRETQHKLVGKHPFANGWTASVINDGYGSEWAPYEVWAWHKDGRRDDDVTGWLTASEAWAFVREVEGRP